MLLRPSRATVLILISKLLWYSRLVAESRRNVGENNKERLPWIGSTSLKNDVKREILSLSRQRRNVADESASLPGPNTTFPGGASLFPCDFEQGFCQWYHSSDSDFTWTRKKGPTPSYDTGPDADHTTGTGWYIYTEASSPRRYGDTAKLTSPTLAPVKPDAVCKMELFLHMKGRDIGYLNIYQAPVEDHDIKKRSWSGDQGRDWLKEEVIFDSREPFQIIVEGIRGPQFRGDIALDDVTFSSGCRRLDPSYVRLGNGTAYNNGLVQVWRSGKWYEVCSSGWTAENSNVTCRELGFSHVVATNSISYPLNVSVQALYNVSCSGSEGSLNTCQITNLTNSSQCSSNTSASVVCSGVADICPAVTHLRCPEDTRGVRKCISRGQLCDFRNDCWDKSDEADCANYTRCSFQKDLCGWLQARNDHMNWTRHNGSTPSSYTGPTMDHNGESDKYYLYIEVSGRHGREKAVLGVTPRFQGNHAGLCKVRFWFHMFGYHIGTLRVWAIDKFSRQIIWTKSRSRGKIWGRAEVTLLNTSSSFQVMFEAEHSGYSYQGDIAIDDVSFTPECRPAPHEIANCTQSSFACNSGECIPLNKQCDFSDDCFDASDEQNCGEHTPGRCNFDEDFCGWTNPTDGDDFNWERRSGPTPTYLSGPLYDHTHGMGGRGYYIYIEASSPRQPYDQAHLQSPQFMLSGVKNCKVRFYYHMYGTFLSMGTLRLKLLNTVTRAASSPIWQMSGSRGSSWHRAEVAIETNWPVVQVIFEGIRGLGYRSDIALDDISFSPACYPQEATHVLRNYDVRLTGGGSSNEGRVEIYRVGRWGTVCQDDWDRKEADVVCGQLGYSLAKVVSHSFGPGKGQIWLDNLGCYGNESKLYECPHNGWAKHDCTHQQDVGVICNLNGARKAVRLAGNRNHSRHGRVDIFYNDGWGSICFDNWDLHDGHVACTQLGFSSIEKITKEPVDPTSKAVMNVSCQGNETTLDRCSNILWGDFSCSTNGFAGVVCKDDGATEGSVRLAGGTSFSNGRVEIFYRGEWGTVCEDKWTTTNARVTCLQLGFTSVANAHQSFGPGRGRVWMDQVNCTGNEASLIQCPQRGWANTPCSHNEDVGIVCSDDAYVGCYINRRPTAMKHVSSSPVMTIVKCVRMCQAQGDTFAGLQWSSECYCGNQYDKYGVAPNEECNTPCSGDVSKKCGGVWRLSVYNTNPAILPSIAPGYAPVRQSCEQYVYMGLYGWYHIVKDNTRYYSGDHGSGEIWSPQFPLNYPNSMSCVWVLNLNPETKAHIEFEHFETEYIYDTLTVKDGKRNFDNDLTPVHGFSGNNSFSLTASSNLMWIKFESDFSENEKGFKLKYTAKGSSTVRPTSTLTSEFSTTFPPTKLPSVQYITGGCTSGFNNQSTFGYYDKYHDSGFITSPGYPFVYPADTECRWSIYVLKGFQIKVSSVAIDIGSTGSRLDVTDDYETWHSKSKQNEKLVFTSRDHYVKVTFVASSKLEGKGFKIEYQRIRLGPSLPAKFKGMSGGSIAGIVLGIVFAVIVIAIFLLVVFKKKKRRRPRATRHSFVNEAYDNAGDISLPRGTTAGEPTVHYAVAPPPYSQLAPTAVPVAAATLTPVDGSQPQAPQYAQLYAIPVAPPVYEAGLAQATGTDKTVTGLGSVTNVREGATTSPSRPNQLQPVALNRHGVLPPIRGSVSTTTTAGSADRNEKKPLNDDEAGPLPQKAPFVVQTPPEILPSAPSRSSVSVRSVSPPPSATEFDQEPPFEFICPITNQVMIDPVKAADGYTYERHAIRSWLSRNPTSPMTGNPILDDTLKVNHELKARIKDFKQKHTTEISV